MCDYLVLTKVYNVCYMIVLFVKQILCFHGSKTCSTFHKSKNEDAFTENQANDYTPVYFTLAVEYRRVIERVHYQSAGLVLKRERNA